MADMRTPQAIVRGLGSAKDGTGHWIAERLTAVANLIAVIWFLAVCIAMSGAGHAEWSALFRSPFHATMMLLLVITSFWHSQLGLQVVIEDYVHAPWLKLPALVANVLVHAALGLACIVAVLMVALRG